MLKNDRHSHRVTWSEEDNEYVGFCAGRLDFARQSGG